jgi:hypothetical protein
MNEENFYTIEDPFNPHLGHFIGVNLMGIWSLWLINGQLACCCCLLF